VVFQTKSRLEKLLSERKYSVKNFASLSVVLAVFSLAAAKADVIADWTFESSGLGSTTPSFSPGVNTATTNFYAELGLEAGTAAAIGLHAGNAAYTGPAGNGSTKSLSSALWAVGDYYQFSVTLDLVDNTYSGINVSYDQNGSATGPKTYYIAYSTDGSSFTKLGSDYGLTSGISWAAATPNQATQLSGDFSSITALNTASTIYFRVVDDSATTGGAINGGNVGTAGTDRIDNFVVNATITAVPEPATLTLVAVGAAAFLVASRRRC